MCINYKRKQNKKKHLKHETIEFLPFSDKQMRLLHKITIKAVNGTQDSLRNMFISLLIN